MPHSPIRVGQWIVKPEINRLEGPNGEQSIGPKVMQLLLVFLHEPGVVHERDKLLREVWSDVIVNEESLTKSISFLRQYFNRDDIQYIETIRAVGYRWIGPKPVNLESTPQITRRTYPKSLMKPVLVVCTLIILGLLSFALINKETERPIPLPIQLTDTKTQERVPRISPDGSSVLFAQYTPQDGSMDIYIKGIATNEIQRLTNSLSLETDPTWSPDGSKVAFYKNNSEDVAIIEVDVNSGKQRKLTDAHAIPNLSAISWSPDGNGIVFCDHDLKTDRWRLMYLNVNTLEKKLLTEPTDCFYGDVNPRYSPDGKQLAFLRINERGLLYQHLIPGIGQVQLMNLEDSTISQVTDNTMEIAGLDWMDQSTHLTLIQVDDFFNFEILTHHIQSGKQNSIYQTPKLLRNLSRDYHNNHLVFEEWTERYSIWKADFSSPSNLENYRPFLDLAAKSWHPQISNDGNSLAYVSSVSGRTELWLRDISTKSDRQLTKINKGIVRNPRWSNDDQRILFESYSDGDFDLHLLDVASGEIDDILHSENYERNASWGLGDESILYIKKYDGKHGVHRYDLITHEDQLLVEGAFSVRESDHGVFYLTFPDYGIKQISREGTSEIIEDIHIADWFNWEVIGNKIYYVSREKEWRPTLKSYDLTTKETTSLTDNHQLEFSHVYQGFSIDKINGVLYATVRDFVQSDIKMIPDVPMVSIQSQELPFHQEFLTFTSSLFVSE